VDIDQHLGQAGRVDSPADLGVPPHGQGAGCRLVLEKTALLVESSEVPR
jgi:hypothetical protein